MEILKKLFPNAFASTEKDNFIKALIIYIVVALIGSLVGFLVGSLVGSLLGGIPVIGAIVGLILYIFGTIVDVYAIGGVILTLLVYFKVIQ